MQENGFKNAVCNMRPFGSLKVLTSAVSGACVFKAAASLSVYQPCVLAGPQWTHVVSKFSQLSHKVCSKLYKTWHKYSLWQCLTQILSRAL